MKNRLLKTFTSLVLTALMVISVMPAFAITIGATGDTYELVTDVSTLTADDKVIIVAKKADGKTYAMSNDQGSSNPPKPVEVTVENDAITNPDDNILWNIANDNGNLTIYPAGKTDTWLYCTKDNNGVRVGTNANKVFTMDSKTGYLKNTATSRFLGVYNTQDWRCYTSTTTNIANQTFSFYKLVNNAEETTTEGGSGSETICDHNKDSDTTTIEKIPAAAATCTTPGNTEYTRCSVCGAVQSEFDTTPPLGHDKVNHDAQTATCTQVGWDAYVTCTRCNYTTYNEIPKTAHNYDENGACTVCGAVKPVEFDYTKGTNAQAPADVTKDYVSLDFDKGDNTTNEPKWYSSGTAIRFYKNNTLTISTTKEGYYIKSITFTFEQGTFVANSGSITNGTWTPGADSKPTSVVFTNTSSTQAWVNNIVVELAPSCLHENTEAIGEAKEATCTEDGITAGSKCSDCGAIIEKRTVIPATGHKNENSDDKCDTCGISLCTEHVWIEDKVKVEGNCTTDRVVSQVCQKCDEPGEDKVTKAPGHTEVIDEAVDATCTETGKTEGKHCSVCNKVLVAQTEVPAKGHECVNGFCKNCGAKIPTYVKVTTAPTDWSGEYLIVYEYEGGNVAFDGSLTTLDAASNTVSVTIVDNEITGDFSAYTFTIAAVEGGYSIQSKSGYYIGQTTNDNGLVTDNSKAYTNAISLNSDGTVNIVSSGAYLRFNSASNQQRFRYYKSASYDSQKAITLYKLNSGSGSESTTPENEPTIKSFSLSLNEGITVKVTFDIPEAWLTANEGAKVVFSNGTKIDAQAGINVYSVDLTPAKINDTLTVKVTNADGFETLVAEKDVSVSTYRDKAEAAGANAKLIALLDAALTYSSVADGTYTGTMEHTFEGVDASSITHKNDGAMLFTGVSGTLGTDASIRITVNPENVKENDTIVLKVGEAEIFRGNIADYITNENKIVITGLYPQHFNDTITITANTEGSSATLSFNSYLKAIYNSSSDQSVKNLAVATYLYGLAAETYLAAQ